MLLQLQYLTIEGSTAHGYIWRRHFTFPCRIADTMLWELESTIEIIFLEPINHKLQIMMVPTCRSHRIIMGVHKT